MLVVTFGKGLLFALAAILPIINPLATAPLFVDLTEGLSHSSRRFLAQRIGLYIFTILAASLLVGSYVLRFFGISLPVVRVAGGLIVASIAWQMLGTMQAASDDKAQIAQTLTEDYVRIRAFYPMTFPLTCGPGSIAVAIAVGASLHTGRVTESAVNLAGGLVAMAIVSALAALTYQYADYVMRWLGKVGQIVFLRLMAFILLCIGVEIVWEGVSALWMELL